MLKTCTCGKFFPDDAAMARHRLESHFHNPILAQPARKSGGLASRATSGPSSANAPHANSPSPGTTSAKKDAAAAEPSIAVSVNGVGNYTVTEFTSSGQAGIQTTPGADNLLQNTNTGPPANLDVFAKGDKEEGGGVKNL